MNRRSILKGVGTISALLAASVLFPRTVFAAYSEKAFKSNKIKDSLNELFGTSEATPSELVAVKFADGGESPIAENGAVVPVEVWTEGGLQADSIAILIEQNPSPLAIVAQIPKGTESKVKTRCRMSKTTNVLAVVNSGGKLYSKTQEVKVTIGGCGG